MHCSVLETELANTKPVVSPKVLTLELSLPAVVSLFEFLNTHRSDIAECMNDFECLHGVYFELFGWEPEHKPMWKGV